MPDNSENIESENNIPTEYKEFAKSLEHALNETYPGATLYIYDSNQSKDVIEKYTPGRIIREPSNLKVSSFSKGGLKTNLRFIVISSHLISIDEALDGGSNDLLGIKGCGIHVSQRDSRFKILDNYEINGKMLITLLHLPDDDSWKLFKNLDNSSGADGEFITYCRKVFEERINLPVRKELDSEAIEKIWEHAPGFNHETNELFNEDDGISAEYHFRYLLEHKILPEAVHQNSKSVISNLTVHKEKFLKEIADQLAENTNETNPYGETDFKVIPIPAKERKCLLIVMPDPLNEHQCRRIYITYTQNPADKKVENVHYFTIETGSSVSETEQQRDYFCEYFYDGSHQNFGTIESLEEEIKLADLYAMNTDFRVRFEQTSLFEKFFQNPKDFMSSLDQYSSRYIEMLSSVYAETYENENPYPEKSVEISNLTAGKYRCYCVSLPGPCSFMQCRRIYFATRRNGKEPILFYVQKRLVGYVLVNHLFMRKENERSNLNSLPNLQEERFRIVCMLEDLK